MSGWINRLSAIGAAAMLFSGVWASAAPCPSPAEPKGCCGADALSCCCCADTVQDASTVADVPRLPSVDFEVPALPPPDPVEAPCLEVLQPEPRLRPNSERGPPATRFLTPGPARAPPLSA